MNPENVPPARLAVPKHSHSFTTTSGSPDGRKADDQPQNDESDRDRVSSSSASHVIPVHSDVFITTSGSPDRRKGKDHPQNDESSANHMIPVRSNKQTDVFNSLQERTTDNQQCSNNDQRTSTTDVREGLHLSLKDVHVARMCGICEKTFAEGRCLDCDEDLCSLCVKYHQKLKITSKHNILFFYPPGNLNQELDASLGVKVRNNCQKHEDEVLRFFCKTCRLPVCRDCVLTSHKNHVTGDILDEAKVAREQIQTLLVKAGNTKQKIESYQDELKVYEGDVLGSSDRVNAMVTRMHKDIADRVEKSFQKLLDTIQSSKKDEIGRIQQYEQFYKEKLVSVSDFLCQGEQLLSTETDTEMVLQMDVLRQSAPALFNVLSLIPGKAEFILSRNGNYAKNTTDNVIGHLSFTVTDSAAQESGKQVYIREVCLKRDMSFHIWEMKCNKPSIRGICQGSNGVIWIATPKSLIQLESDGTRQNSVHLTADVLCISEGHEGKPLVAFSRVNGIKVFSHGFINTWSNYATIPETIVTLSTADGKRVFVTSAMTRNLIVFSNQGKEVVKVRLPEELFQDDAVITGTAVGADGEVAISNNKGKLVILSALFETKHIYNELDGIMFPTCICYDKQDHLIIADSKGRTVHLLSKSGCFLAVLLNKDDFQDIGSPTAICVDEQQRLWVGTNMGNICAYKYIHDVL